MKVLDLVKKHGWVGLTSLAASIPFPLANANAFFVDNSVTEALDADDGVHGQTWAAPLASIDYAIGLCTADQGDMIFVSPAHNDSPTAAINFDVSGISLIACGGGFNPQEPEKIAIWPNASYTTGPVAIITAPCRIEGFEFVSRATTGGFSDAQTTVGAAVAIAGEGGSYTGSYSLFKNCKFVCDWWSTPYGVASSAGAYNRFEGCTFQGAVTSGIAFRGSSSNNPTHNIIEDCKFIDCVNGIEHAPGTVQNFLYKGNVFIDCTIPIDFNNQGADGLVCNNFFEVANTSAYDQTVGTLQALGINFSGNHYSE